MVMKPAISLRHILFLPQELYAQLLNVSGSLIGLIESNRRILRGSPLAIEGKFYAQWEAMAFPDLEIPVTSSGEEQATLDYLTDLKAKLLHKKRTLEEELAECQNLKAQAQKAIYFYENRDRITDNETETLVLGLGYRKAKQEYERMSPTLLLDLERKLRMVESQLVWVGEKRGINRT